MVLIVAELPIVAEFFCAVGRGTPQMIKLNVGIGDDKRGRLSVPVFFTSWN